MTLRSLLPSWASGIWGRPDARSEDLHSAETLRDVLDREQSRTARNDVGFSVVYVHFAPRQESAMRRFATIARRRLRSTDEVAFTEDGRVALVLPETHQLGAATVVKEIVKEIAEIGHGGEFVLDYEIRFHASPLVTPRAVRET